jgi:AAA+ ATPase superfamily predicted ATPase
MTSTPFIGRETELNQLCTFLDKLSASLIAIKGRRRVGKSRLIEEFAKNKTFYSFVGLAPKKGVTAQKQREEFARKLEEYFGIGGIKTDDWGNLFSLLANQTKQGRVIISLDEISWMGRGDSTFLSKLRNAWDTSFKNNPKIILFLCSSISSWLEQNVLSSTGFFGRISLTLTVDELPLNDCSKLLTSRGFHGSSYEKFKILSITGGIPWYIEQIQANDNANSFILRNCFTKGGVLTDDFNKIFHDLFHKRNIVYKKIIELLASGTLEFNDLCNQLGYNKSGKISKYLQDLIEAGFIHRDYTWILKTGRKSRLSNYRLSDNYLRFYLKYIEPNMHKILLNRFENISLSSLPGWYSIMGLQFENLVLQNRNYILHTLNIKNEDIVADNPFFQRKTKAKPGCQIDYLIQTKFNTLFACEIKFSKNVLTKAIIEEVEQKIKRLTLPRNFSCFPVLIHISEVAESVIDSGYFSKVIDFNEFLH